MLIRALYYYSVYFFPHEASLQAQKQHFFPKKKPSISRKKIEEGENSKDESEREEKTGPNLTEISNVSHLSLNRIQYTSLIPIKIEYDLHCVTSFGYCHYSGNHRSHYIFAQLYGNPFYAPTSSSYSPQNHNVSLISSFSKYVRDLLIST